MNIIEATKISHNSGTPIRRSIWQKDPWIVAYLGEFKYCCCDHDDSPGDFSIDDILADDWITKED